MSDTGDLLYDPTARSFGPVPESLKTATQGVTWNGYFLVGSHAYRGPKLEEASPLPFPAPPPCRQRNAITLSSASRIG